MKKILLVLCILAALLPLAGMDYYRSLGGHASAMPLEVDAEVLDPFLNRLKSQIETKKFGWNGFAFSGVTFQKRLRKDIKALIFRAVDEYDYEDGEFYLTEVSLSDYKGRERYISVVSIENGGLVILNSLCVELQKIEGESGE